LGDYLGDLSLGDCATGLLGNVLVDVDITGLVGWDSRGDGHWSSACWGIELAWVYHAGFLPSSGDLCRWWLSMLGFYSLWVQVSLWGGSSPGFVSIGLNGHLGSSRWWFHGLGLSW